MDINHVALLVPSVKKAASALARFNFAIGPAESWEGEGTLEIYVGDTAAQTSLLLLMEPEREGAYSRAMLKRGPGLHHIAIDVLDLESFIDSMAGTGWLLHPRSLRTMKHSQTAYLARPGLPLIEVQQRSEIVTKPRLIERLEMPLQPRELTMMRALGLAQVDDSRTAQTIINFAHEKVDMSELL